MVRHAFRTRDSCKSNYFNAMKVVTLVHECLRTTGGRHECNGTDGDSDGGDDFGGWGGVWDGLGVSARGVSVDAAGCGTTAVGAGAGDSGSGAGVWPELEADN